MNWFCVVLWPVCSHDHGHSHSFKIYSTINICVLLFSHSLLLFHFLHSPCSAFGNHSSCLDSTILPFQGCSLTDPTVLTLSGLAHFGFIPWISIWLLWLSKVCSFIMLDRIAWCLCCPSTSSPVKRHWSPLGFWILSVKLTETYDIAFKKHTI